MAKRKKSSDPTPVEAITHDGEKRVNLPTAGAHEFVSPEVEATKKVSYPRDSSLDPQLVWRGKDEQDSTDLEVEAPPIFIQEKIDPRVLVENLRKTANKGQPEPELTLFDDFDGLSGLDDIEYYQHAANWSNRVILGDSLQVMSSLAEREAMRGQVQMVYVDPPYGIKFGSNWQARVDSRSVTDGKYEATSREVEQIRAFRDTWELGIHSYLAYLRDRLIAARDLLTSSGSIFVQIGDENVHLVRAVLDEVFGSENFVNQIAFQKTSGAGSPSGTTNVLAQVYDYLLWYAKDIDSVKYRELLLPKGIDSFIPSAYNKVEEAVGSRRSATKAEKQGVLAEGARLYALDNLTSQSGVDKTRYEVEIDGRTFTPGRQVWKTGAEGMDRLIAANRVEATKSRIGYVRYLDDFPAVRLTNLWTDTVSSFMSDKVYVVQTNTKVVERCLLMTTDPGDLVVDPTCGGGTTAFVAEHWGRRWITIDTSRVALALARQRLLGARFPYYILVDSPEGLRALGKADQASDGQGTASDIREGFVYQTIPHITLRSIANNPDIQPGMSRSEIAEAIEQHAGREFLFDDPLEDPKKVRVSGPFTIEGLSPHRSTWSTGDLGEAVDQNGGTTIERTILDNLSSAGIQNGRRQERLEIEALEPFASPLINAVGEATAAKGSPFRVAITIGPQFGTVGPSLIKDAAREAMKVGDIDLLCVLGFAFDPAAVGTLDDSTVTSDEGFDVAAERKLGSVPVLIVRMNADLVMGEELKKTGTGNLFTVFGEPDIVVRESEGGELIVELRGVDVYDPTTGELRSDSTDQVALWMIDTVYNEESFFVRHCYFTGGLDPYERLKTALKADIDEDAWATLYRTESRPFARPDTGKIAVKVINDYGDEVMKILEV